MESLKKQTKPKNPKKKTVKRKPRKKPAVKKSIKQKQTVTQNVKVVVGELKQRRRQNRSLFHKQPQRQYQQPPTIIYQQAPIQQVAPQSLIPQQQLPQQQPQQPQPQPQPQQQTAPITQPTPQPTPQPLTTPQTQPTPSPLTQPTAPPQASPVTPTIPTPPPPIQPQTTTPPPITPIVPSIEPRDRTVTRPTSPAEPLTRPAPSLSLMEQIQQRARERANRVSSSTDALTEPPKTSQIPPSISLSLQDQIQQKAKERQARVDLGDERKTEQPKGKGSLTTTLPSPKTDLMAEILKKGKELKPISARPKTTPLPPKPDEKSTMVDLMKSKMKGRRVEIEGGSDDEDDVGAFAVASELPPKEIITPEIVTVAAAPLLQPSNEDETTLDDLTNPKPKGGVYNLEGKFIRGSTTGRKRGIPKDAEQAFNEYITKHSKTKVKKSSSAEAVDGKITTKEMTFKKNKKYIEDFNKLLALTGDTEKGLEAKLKRANQGKFPQFV